ncbi:MAG: hypothetical protein KTR31_19880 [Myxococcales bacterium]|nr:hypothetical protein [Myxococcales bacterium]
MTRWIGLLAVAACSGDAATDMGGDPTDGQTPSGEEDCVQDTWFVDADQDGFGAGDAVTDCADLRPPISSNVDGDCDDSDPARNPDATEVCNEIDDDCDDAIDDADDDVDVTGEDVFYRDADEDGFGDAAVTRMACMLPDGFVLNADDCDDSAPGTNPDAVETCFDETDVNCDGEDPADDADADGVLACEDCDESDKTVGLPSLRWFDEDGDGYGDVTIQVLSCIDLKGWVSNPDDCVPTNKAINPGATEVCNEIDDDCDNDIDDADDSIDPKTQVVYYRDRDGDGFGNANSSVSRCVQPSDHVLDDTDCDDTSSKIGDPTPWWPDTDGDGYGDGDVDAVNACDAPIDTVGNDSDCNDGDGGINPDTEWFQDDDGDGYGDPEFSRIQCEQPPSYVLDDTDCDDTDELVNPDTEWFEDADDDGFGNASVSVVQCADPGASVLDDTDCDDTTHLVYPTRFDFDDDIDNNCDGSVDEDVGSETVTWDGDVQAIMDTHCISCHGDKVADAGLDLEAGYVNVFSVVSSQLATMDLVTPGDAGNSYLWRKVEGTHLDVSGSGDIMPPKGGLSDQELLDLEQWIFEGAAQN